MNFFWLILLFLAIFFILFSFLFARITYKRIFRYHYHFKGEKKSLYQKKPYSFETKKGTLKGFLYSKGESSYLLVLVHGLLAEHQEYLAFIDALVEAGFDVFAYDCLGCGESSGKGILSLNQSKKDLITVLKEIHHWSQYKKISLIGHSLGGYAVVALPQEYKIRIDKIISIAGFEKRQNIIRKTSMGNVPSIFKFFLFPFLLLFERMHGKFLKNEIKNEIQKTPNISYMIWHSKDDKTVPLSSSILFSLKEENFPNVTKHLFENREHNYFLLTEACKKYRKEKFALYRKMKKEKKIKTYEDFEKKYVDLSCFNEIDPSTFRMLKDFLYE